MPIDFRSEPLEFVRLTEEGYLEDEGEAWVMVKKRMELIYNKFRVGQRVRVDYKNSCGGGKWTGIGEIMNAHRDVKLRIKILEVHQREQGGYAHVGMDWILFPNEVFPKSSIYSDLLKGINK